jgi:hypothetical protein
MATKEIPVHKDKLGRDITLGDCVAVAHHNGMEIAKVVKINPKMVKVEILNVEKRTWYSGEHNKYGMQMVVIDSQDVTMYLLKGNNG